MLYAEFQAELLGIVGGASGASLGAPPSGSTPYVAKTLFTDIEAAHLSIVEFLKDAETNRGRPLPPYVFAMVGEKSHDPQWGVASRTYRRPLTVAVIALPSKGATQQSVDDLAESIAAAIDDGDLEEPFDSFQSPPERASIDSSSGNSVFSALMIESKVEIVAATVRWSPGLLVID